MRISSEILALVLVGKVVLDAFNGKKSSLAFDILFIVVFIVLGVTTIMSDDPSAAFLGRISLAIAVVWSIWLFWRKFDPIARYRKPSKSPESTNK